MNRKHLALRYGIILAAALALVSGWTPGLGAPGNPPCPPGTSPNSETGVCESRLETPEFFAESVAASPTGGPDVFGYTWDATVSYAWKSATSWTTLFPDPGDPLTGVDDGTAIIALPFTFPFYESAYDQVYVSTNGLISFDESVSAKAHSVENLFVPFDYPFPQNLIAAFWDELAVGGGFDAGYNDGVIRVGPGSDVNGSYFVIEWNNVTRKFGGEDAELTFQVVLYAAGDILIQYQTIEAGVLLDSCTVGIEDQDGLDGLQYLYNSPDLFSGEAILFARPGAANRVKFFPERQDGYITGGLAHFEFYVRNTGEIGNDLYNLSVASSDPGWSLGLYDQDGLDELGDADSNGAPDTGWLSQGETYTVTVVVRAPADAEVGEQSAFTLTATTHSLPQKNREAQLVAAVPTDYALLYRDGTEVQVDFLHRDIIYTGTGHSDYTGSDFALSNPTPVGTYVTVREKARPAYLNPNYTDLEITVLGGTGHVFLGPFVMWHQLDPSQWPSSINPWRDIRPAVAVAPNGNIGIAWVRVGTKIIDGSNDIRHNIFFALMNPQGELIYDTYVDYGVKNVTGNTLYFDFDDPIKLAYEEVNLLATPDNRFHLSWIEKHTISGRFAGDLSHAVYNGYTSAEIKGPEILTDNDIFNLDDWWEPSLANYSPSQGVNRVMLSYAFRDTDENPSAALMYRLMGTDGSPIQAETSLYAVDGEGLDAVQLSDGRMALAWNDPEEGTVYCSVLEQDLSAPPAPTALDNPDDRRGGAVSVAADDAGRAIVSWMDIKWFGRLYAALVDHNGVITPPMTIKYTDSSLETALQTRVALGNASYEPWFTVNLPIVIR